MRVAAAPQQSAGSLPSWAVDGGASSSLHPELRSRLRELGIGLSSATVGSDHPRPEAAVPARKATPSVSPSDGSCTANSTKSVCPPQVANGVSGPATVPCLRLPGGSSEDANDSAPSIRRREERAGAMEGSRQRLGSDCAGGLNPDVDLLLLQLDDLDARTEALSKDKPSTLAAPPEVRTSVEVVAKPQLTAAETVTRHGARPQHKHRLPRIAGTDSPWHGQNRMSKAQKVLDLAPSFADGFTHTFVDSVDAAQHSGASPSNEPHGKKAATSCVSLPPLKSSASAPGCLVHGSWPSVASRRC